MAKIKGKRGFRFIKELGGAIRRETVSKTARYLDERRLLRGRVLDYGFGFGFDAGHYGWEAYDPHYRQKVPEGRFDTVVCNHVANMLTRDSREELFRAILALLAPEGRALRLGVAEAPEEGKDRPAEAHPELRRADLARAVPRRGARDLPARSRPRLRGPDPGGRGPTLMVGMV